MVSPHARLSKLQLLVSRPNDPRPQQYSSSGRYLVHRFLPEFSDHASPAAARPLSRTSGRLIFIIIVIDGVPTAGPGQPAPWRSVLDGTGDAARRQVGEPPAGLLLSALFALYHPQPLKIYCGSTAASTSRVEHAGPAGSDGAATNGSRRRKTVGRPGCSVSGVALSPRGGRCAAVSSREHPGTGGSVPAVAFCFPSRAGGRGDSVLLPQPRMQLCRPAR